MELDKSKTDAKNRKQRSSRSGKSSRDYDKCNAKDIIKNDSRILNETAQKLNFPIECQRCNTKYLNQKFKNENSCLPES